MCMVECGHVKWCADTWWSHVIWGELWCDMKCGVLTCGGVESRDLKWIMVRYEMWCADMWWSRVTWFEVNYGAIWNVVCWHVVESSHVIWSELWCDMKCGVMCMWNVVRCGMLHFQTWCDVKCKMCDVEYGVVWTVVPRQLCGMLHNAKCGKLGDVKCGGVELWWWRMWHMQCAVVVWRQMWKMMQCVVMSALLVWRCK